MQILFSTILYYLILKVKLYIHHYLTIILIISFGFIIDIVLENIFYDVKNNLLFLLLRLLKEMIASLFYVYLKFIIERKFCLIYEILFFIGIIELLLYGIFAIFDYYYIGSNNYVKYFNEFDGEELFVLLGEMILQFFLYLSILFTIKNNSPCHVFIIFIFGHLAHYFLSLSGYAIIIIILCLIIILFLSLIFNEIIEINICGLSNNTKKNIMKRAETEASEESFFLKDDET